MKYHVIYVTMGMFCNESFSSEDKARAFVCRRDISEFMIVHGDIIL